MTSNPHLFSFLILCNHTRMVLSRNLATSILYYPHKDPYHRSMTTQIFFLLYKLDKKKEELSCKVHIIDIWAPIKPILHIIECYVVSHAFRKIEPLLYHMRMGISCNVLFEYLYGYQLSYCSRIKQPESTYRDHCSSVILPVVCICTRKTKIQE